MSFLKLLFNISLVFILFFSVTLFAEDEDVTGYVFINFAKNHLKEKGEDSEKIIDTELQNKIIQRTQFWTVEEARNFLNFLLENIGPDETTTSIRNGFDIISFEGVSYSEFMEMVNLFVKHIGKEALAARLLRSLKSQDYIMPECGEDIEEIENLILFIKEYVKDENTAAEIIINNELSIIRADDRLRQFLRYLEEKEFEKTSIVELMKINLSGLYPYSRIERKIEFLMNYGFSKSNILEILKSDKLDTLHLNELETLLGHLENVGLKKPIIIDVVTKNFYGLGYRLEENTFHTDFSDLKDVMHFLRGYIGEEAVNQMASESFMLFYNVKTNELKQLIKSLEEYLGEELPVEFFYDLTLYNNNDSVSSDNLTSFLRGLVNIITQLEEISDTVCLMALTGLSVSYNLPIKNSFYFMSTFFNLKRYYSQLNLE